MGTGMKAIKISVPNYEYIKITDIEEVELSCEKEPAYSHKTYYVARAIEHLFPLIRMKRIFVSEPAYGGSSMRWYRWPSLDRMDNTFSVGMFDVMKAIKLEKEVDNERKYIANTIKKNPPKTAI